MILRHARDGWRRLQQKMSPRSGPTAQVERAPATLASQLAEGRLSPEEWIRRRRTSNALYVGVASDTAPRMRVRDVERVAGTVKAAEGYLRHEFSLLGSGPFVPADPERSAHDGYQPIDWYLDPVRGLRFPRGVPYKDWKLYDMRPGNADVKYPWELARCQHWATLGQAFLITGDERFAHEIFRQLDDFVDANPVGIGINWTCTMDVALRAVSWAVGLDLVRGASLDEASWERAFRALFDHGTFIRANLENTYEVTSNHFLSNVVGLWFLGAVFADLPEGQAWTAFARESLENEIDVQVLPDGADFESSVPYHRLVTELFLGCARLGQAMGAPLSSHYMSRVHDMVNYLADVLRPDGLMPQVGDADDGRLHVLADAGRWEPQGARHLLGPAGFMFDETGWITVGGNVGLWEASWWGYAVDEASPIVAGAPPSIARLFPDAGVAVAREQSGHYLLVTNAAVGTKGFGNHKHNDQLSFEYHVAGAPVVVDPGSFVYTSDADMRNLFRGTRSHSTLDVDGVEQNELNPEWLFRLFETARAEHLAFANTDCVVEYRGRHVGYTRLENPVVHERRFRFDRKTGRLLIGDHLEGRGIHVLRWHFHIAPGVDVQQQDARRFLLTAAGVTVRLDVPEGLDGSVSSAWYSPSYGVRIPCLAIDLRASVELEGVRTWAFVLCDASLDPFTTDATGFLAGLQS